MIGIGDFARLGRVSVRTLRHYDDLGLLVPARVDASSGYRYYEPAQVRRLNRVVALKDLGLRLDEVRRIVDEQVTGEELRAMLRLRQAEIESQLAEAQHRLARVQARLRLIESEESMSSPDITVKDVAALTTAGLSGIAASATHDDIGGVIGPMYPRIIAILNEAGVVPVGPSVAYYTPAPDVSEDALRVHATFPLAVDAVPGLETVHIPGGRVASTIHRGSMDGVDEAYQMLHAWVQERGLHASGDAREVYLDASGDQSEWVTEVQLDVS